tara:strand:+ start:521 stop:1873 length:1353 start_codon:yes stop_codon:yes gene_type:complete
MAKIRIGFGTELNIGSELSGIGTDNPTNTKQVLGNIHATNAKAVGISTLATYQGFLDKEARFGKSVIDINAQAGTLGEIVIDGEVTVSSGSTLCSGVDELTITDSFSLPTGNTDSRIHCKTAGSMRFNEDFGTLEFYTGDEWRTVNSFKDTGNRGRGVFGGGQSPATQQVIDFVNIASTGNALNFGELTSAKHSVGAVSSAIRGIYAGEGPGAGVTTDMDYITIASQSNAIDFGDLTAARRNTMGMSSSTRGIFCGGVPAPTTVDYIQIATLGNAVSFGTAIFGVSYGLGNMSNGVRGLAGGGQVNGTPRETGLISFIFSSLGNGTNFGDMTVGRSSSCGCSNSTRGIILGGTINGSSKPDVQSSMEFINIASEGNGTIFGDLTDARSSINACASQTRGVAAGGGNDPITNIIDFVNIVNLGNALDFGDLSVGRVHAVALSDSHGGLGGY